MDISIDMLSLGNADGMIVWLKDDSGSMVILVDAGNLEDGKKMVSHLGKYILPNVSQEAPDLIISTHSDKDHIGGLIEVVKHYKNKIQEVWVHDPALHMESTFYDYMKNYLKGKTSEKRYQLILESLENLEDFLQVVDRYGIPRREPFYDVDVYGGLLKVLGPTEEYYESLIPKFEDLEDYLTEEAEYEFQVYSEEPELTLKGLLLDTMDDDSPCPAVDENNETSAENNSSVILEINVKENRYLFTGDAGVPALTNAHDISSLEDIYWLDIPHHGSRRNLSSGLIGIMKPKIAYVSAKGDKKHPRMALVNCLKRSNTTVYSTHKGGNKWHHRGDFPEREDYSTAEPL